LAASAAGAEYTGKRSLHRIRLKAKEGVEVPENSAGTLAPPPAAKLKIKPPRIAGTLYRGREGMWSWVLHRITGIAIYFFLLVHILDTSIVRISPQAYNGVIDQYKQPIMGLGEFALVVAIVYHALNGLRIICIDFFSWGARHQRMLFVIVIVLWVIIIAGFAPEQIRSIVLEIQGHPSAS
jgi:succinate dehydrogenase / fumarate reductase cytochrome b subunit